LINRPETYTDFHGENQGIDQGAKNLHLWNVDKIRIRSVATAATHAAKKEFAVIA
jgi:hypothetical protein